MTDVPLARPSGFASTKSLPASFWFGLTLILFWVVAGILSPWISPFDPNQVDIYNRLAVPSLAHPFGTDELGRDILSRMLHGALISVSMGVLIAGIVGVLGLFIGACSGYLGGWTDLVVMRVTDVIMSVPGLVLAMALAAALGPNLINASIALIFMALPGFIRVARGQALVIKNSAYVEAATTFKRPRFAILVEHIIPNSIAPIIVSATLGVGNIILAAAALSFLGLGVQPPTSDWGGLIATGRQYLATHWWYPAAPGLAILTVALGFNLVGDTLNELVDPRQRAVK
jgi:peptide/nickel transport system permease protein